MDTHISVSDTKQDESTIASGIKVKGSRTRISGVVLRIQQIPRAVGTEPDYKMSIWLPNFKVIEASDVHGYVAWADLMAALIEAATGKKPTTGREEKVVEVNGIPMRVLVFDEDDDGIEDSQIVDPMKEEIIMKDKPQTITTQPPSTALAALENKMDSVEKDLKTIESKWSRDKAQREQSKHGIA